MNMNEVFTAGFVENLKILFVGLIIYAIIFAMLKKIDILGSEKVNNLLGSIGAFDVNTQTPDDLKEISGVGPKMEGVLNSIGIYSFLQVSKMTKKEYDLLDSITESFPGRAERDDWAGQAKKLIN